MDLGMRSTSHYDSMPCMNVASLEMSDEPKIRIYVRVKRAFTKQIRAFFQRDYSASSTPSRTRREVFFTSRRLFRTSPGVDKSSPGLDKTSPGLVGSNSRTCGRSISFSLLYGCQVNVQCRQAATRRGGA